MAVTISQNRNWSEYECTSSTSFAVNTAALTAISLTIQTGRPWVAGDDIALVPTSPAPKIPFMIIGTVTSYDSATGALVVNSARLESSIPSWDLVSASTVTIAATGSRTLVTYNGKSSMLAAGDPIIVSRRSVSGANRMVGTVGSYDNANGTLVFNVTGSTGSGTNQVDWIIISSGTYTSWDVVPSPIATYSVIGSSVLTYDKEPIYPIGSTSVLTQGRCAITNNTSNLWTFNLGSKNTNTAKIFNAEVNGELVFTGGRIEIATGTGLAGQTIDLSAYTKLDMPFIEVETANASGVYRPWYVFENSNVVRGYIGLNWLSRGYNFSFTNKSSTVTLTTASPTVVTWNSHGLRIGQRVTFTTTGTFTGITASTTYFIIPTDFTANSFKIGVIMGTATGINVTAQSGTHTCNAIPDFGTDLQGNVLLYNPTTKILTCGDGTTGNTIPNGAKVRMPNINFTMEYPRCPIMSAISSATAGNAVTFVVGHVTNIIAPSTTTTFQINGEEFTGVISTITLTTATRAVNGTIAANHAQGDTMYSHLLTTTRGLIDTADGGKVTMNCVSFSGIYLNMLAYQSLSMTDVWVSGGCSNGGTTSDTVINGLFNHPYPVLDTSGVGVNSILGTTDVRRIYSASTAFALNAAPQNILLSNDQNIIRAEDFEALVMHRNGNAQPAGIYFNINTINCTPKRLTLIGGRITFTSSFNFEVEDLKIGAESNGLLSTSVATIAINTTNCQNAIFRNISKPTNGSAHRTAVIATDSNCSNLLFHTIDYNCQSHCGQIATALGNQIKIANGVFGAIRDASGANTGAWGIGNSSSSDGAVLQNCTFTGLDTYGTDNGLGVAPRCFMDSVSGHSMWWKSTGAFAPNYQEIGPFHVLLDTGKASGVLYYTPSVKAVRKIYDLNGTAYFDNSGSLILPVSGDYAIIKSYQVLRTITGFSGTVTPEEINAGNMTYEFELVNYDGTFATSWTALTTANLNSALSAITGYDDEKGFHIRIKIIATVTNELNRVINLRMFTTNNASAVLPIGFTDYTINNLQGTCTAIGIFDGSIEEEYDYCTLNSNLSHLPYEFNGNDKTLSVKIRNLAYTWDDHTVTFDQYPLSYVSKQVLNTEITEATVATVQSYTTLETAAKLYDYSTYWGTLRANLVVDRVCKKSGSTLNFGDYDVVIDATAVSLFARTATTITIKASSFSGVIVTTGTVTTTNGATLPATYTDSTGSHIPASISGLSAGSRIQIYNLTTDTEIKNEVAGTSFQYTYIEGGDFTAGDSIRIRATKKGFLPWEGFAVSTVNGWSVLANQQVDSIYNQFNTDGATITEFVWDGTHLEVDIDDANNETIIQRIAAWSAYFVTTEVGIRDFFGCIVWEFYNQVRVNSSCNIKLDNKKAEALLLSGGRLYRSDGQSIISDDTTGPIHVVGGVGSAQGSGSAIIVIDTDSGLVVTAKIFTLAGVQQGTTVNLTDNGSGLYTGSFSLSGVADGEYAVRFLNGSIKIGYGSLFVRGENEVSQDNFFDPNFDIVQSVSSTAITLDSLTLDEIEASTVLAKQATSKTILGLVV